ncbi:rod shape-determining protein MreC [Patescibacteria group bacterium]|nr:MAG: rod shape-determining protein MreC [Patescibacteria group bacterium]
MTSRRRTFLILTAAGLLAGGALFVALPVFGPARGALSRLALAPGDALSATGARIAAIWTRPAPEELTAVRTERDALVVENARLRIQAQEAEELRGILSYRERTRQRLEPARIIGRSGDLAIQAVMIDRGSDDGVAPGMAVIVGDGFYIGTVRKTAPRTAVVLLALDGRNRTAAAIQNGARTVGYVEGGRGLGMALRLIPQDEKVETGQLVVTSGLDPAVPRGLIIGRVERVSREPQEPFQTAVVSQIVSAERNATVAVVIPDAVLEL